MNRSGLFATAAVAVGVATVAALVAPGERSVAPAANSAAEKFDAVTACAAGPAMVCDAIDTGLARGPARYRRVEVPSQDCATYKRFSDGGVESAGLENRPAKPSARLETIPGSCVPALSVAGARAVDGGVAFLAQGCACRRASGVCRYALPDGGLATAPTGKTLGPGYPPFERWSGAGCQPKACVEFAGESSWPASCPR